MLVQLTEQYQKFRGSIEATWRHLREMYVYTIPSRFNEHTLVSKQASRTKLVDCFSPIMNDYNERTKLMQMAGLQPEFAWAWPHLNPTLLNWVRTAQRRVWKAWSLLRRLLFHRVVSDLFNVPAIRYDITRTHRFARNHFVCYNNSKCLSLVGKSVSLLLGTVPTENPFNHTLATAELL